MNIEEVAFIRPEVEPSKFLSLLSRVAARVESGNSSSISLKECSDWGLPPAEAIPCMLLLVRSGILRQKVAVYNEEEDFYDDVSNPEMIRGRPLEEIRFWFTPRLGAGDLKPFFA